MHIGPYRIGPVPVAPAPAAAPVPSLALAPMAGVTDRAFRALCRRLGAGLATSEMTIADPRLWETPKSRTRMDHTGEPGPISVQIAGHDPTMLAEAARHNVDQGAEIIDINMGCPAKKVCRVDAGSALMRDEPLVARICAAVVAAVPVPVTLKIRSGWAQAQRNGVQIARIAEDCGIAALAVHGRTRADRFEGAAEYATIAAVVDAVRIPVWANGDIDSPEKARSVLMQTRAAGLMIGRAAQGRPWIFREIAHFLATGALLPPPSREETAALLIEHLGSLYALYGEHHGVRVARKHIHWYCAGCTEAAAFRVTVNGASSAAAQTELVRRYFDDRWLQAAA